MIAELANIPSLCYNVGKFIRNRKGLKLNINPDSLARLVKRTPSRVREVLHKARQAHPREPRAQIRHAILILVPDIEKAEELIEELGATRSAAVRPGLAKLAHRVRDAFARAQSNMGEDLQGCSVHDVMVDALPGEDPNDILDAILLAGIVIEESHA